MDIELLNDRDVDFLLYEFLDTDALLERPVYCEHSREIFNAVLDTAKSIAKDKFANHSHKGDANEPQFDGQQLTLIPETKAAWDAWAEAGFLAAHYSLDEGGMQLPETVMRIAMAYPTAANASTAAYGFLTIGAANLIRAFAASELQARFLPAMKMGRFSGTMALTEPNQGSSLADISTRAIEQADGSYKLHGQKMYISGGDHELTDNIVHMVLAKIDGAPAGVKGISLFICPKFLVNEDGSVGERNDVQLAGLLHKMGNRNTTSTVLNFGEQDGATAYLVGKPHHGLLYMFQMMNEARIGVGAGAAIIAYQGYNYSLNYARERPQGRPVSNKDPQSKQVPIIQHADVRRMLLAQKSYAEGALALCMYGSSLFEDSRSAASSDEKESAHELLELLIPVIKSWPSKYGPEANSLAIQVLGGSGYIREYPVEQYYRDNRLNSIHEGAEGIHGLDLLGRKVLQKNGMGFTLLMEKMDQTIAEAKPVLALADLASNLHVGSSTLSQVTQSLLGLLGEDLELALANATIYLDLMGRVVVSWIWLRQALVASAGLEKAMDSEQESAFYHGKIQAARYFIEWELPQINMQAKILMDHSDVCYAMRDEWF